MQKEKIIILGVPIDTLEKPEALDMLFEENGGQKHLITVNPEMILAAQEDGEFMNILQKSAINTPDGTGILWAASSQKKSLVISIIHLVFLIFKKPHHPIPELIKGSDLVRDIAERSAKSGEKIFLLGSQTGIADEAKKKLEEKFPGVKIVGTYAGSPSRYEEEKIKDIINDTEPDILFVAYGSPEQEKWIVRNLHKMPTIRAAIGIGGAFDFISGRIQRAPIWLQNLGLEWLYRLIKQPSRWRRIRNAVVTFPYIFLTKRTKNTK
jgi:N-acetylglucosaminyldiphosphoundecaprenol N-acetyl-beta-D-mannosaminyltransferase